MLKSPRKYNIAVATYIWITMQMWFSFPGFIHSLSWHKIFPTERDAWHEASSEELPFKFTSLIAQFYTGSEPCTRVPHYWSGYLRKTFRLLINSGKTVDQLIHSTNTVIYLKQRPPSISLKFSCGHSLPFSESFMSTSSLPVSTEHSSQRRFVSISHKHMMWKSS